MQELEQASVLAQASEQGLVMEPAREKARVQELGKESAREKGPALVVWEQEQDSVQVSQQPAPSCHHFRRMR